jgi:hypothetical protein
MEEGLIAGIAAIFLGILAILVGWTIIGGLGLGITALLLAIHSYRKGHRLLGVFGILFSCVGIVEGLVVAGMIGFLSVLTMPTRVETTITPTIRAETVTKTITIITQTITVRETITKTLEKIASTIKTTETIKGEHIILQPQILKWRLLWEKRLNDTAYQLKVSPNGKFVAIIAQSQLIVFSKDGNINYSVREFPNPPRLPMAPYRLLRISDEGESWILTYEDNLVVVKDGKAVWRIDLREIFSNYRVSAAVISRDEKYIATVFGDWIYFARRENNNLVLLWKFKLIEGTLGYPYNERIDISADNRYLCIVGYDWITLLDAQGKLIWENDYGLGTHGSPPYLINSKLIGIANTYDNVVLIVDLEGQLIRKIRLEDEYVMFPDPIVVNNLIIGVARINGTEVLRVYDWEGKPIYTFKPKGDNIFAIACSLDGKYIAISDNALRVYLLERED